MPIKGTWTDHEKRIKETIADIIIQEHPESCSSKFATSPAGIAAANRAKTMADACMTLAKAKDRYILHTTGTAKVQKFVKPSEEELAASKLDFESYFTERVILAAYKESGLDKQTLFDYDISGRPKDFTLLNAIKTSLLNQASLSPQKEAL